MSTLEMKQNGLERAAILVSLLDQDSAALLFEQLDPEPAAAIRTELLRMDLISKDQYQNVADLFLDETKFLFDLSHPLPGPHHKMTVKEKTPIANTQPAAVQDEEYASEEDRSHWEEQLVRLFDEEDDDEDATLVRLDPRAHELSSPHFVKQESTKSKELMNESPHQEQVSNEREEWIKTPFEFLSDRSIRTIADRLSQERAGLIAIVLRHFCEKKRDNVLNYFSQTKRDIVLDYLRSTNEVDSELLQKIARTIEQQWKQMDERS